MPTQMLMGLPAETLISGISATFQAIQTWVVYRDSQRAATAFNREFEEALSRSEIKQEAQALGDTVPPEVISTLTERAQGCWSRYHDMLSAPAGVYLPSDLDSATRAVKVCVCTELNRIKSLSGSLPSGVLTIWWSELDCDSLVGPIG